MATVLSRAQSVNVLIKHARGKAKKDRLGQPVSFYIHKMVTYSIIQYKQPHVYYQSYVLLSFMSDKNWSH